MGKYIKSILLVFLLFSINSTQSQETVTVNSKIKHQNFKGWGVSLSWWANEVGNTFPDESLNLFCKWFTDPQELNMNVFRYNISGGDAPGHQHMRKDAQIQGYKNAENESYNWSNDSAQRKILLKVHQMCPDGIYEAANYSPPFWMTKSGCSAGEPNGLDNLKDDYYDDFAQYLADCVKHYKEKYGVTFSTISPINEPFSDWWKSNGSQEGCYFSQSNQERIIRELHQELKSQKMLSYTGLSMMDANSIDECLNGIKEYEKAGLLPFIKQINVHSYAGDKRAALNEIVKKNKLTLWQSESGPLWVKEKGFDNFLFMAKRIVTDMRELKPDVWCDWQYMGGEFGSAWALVGYNLKDQTFERTKGFYCRKQFSHFIKKGYNIIESDNPNTLSALSPDGKTMVVVIVNSELENKSCLVKINGKKFKSVKYYRTSETEDFATISQNNTSFLEGLAVELKSKSITSIILNKN